MGAAQANNTNHTTAIRARRAIRFTFNQAIEPKARFFEARIGHIGQHIKIRGAGERKAMFGNVRSVFVRVELDGHVNLCSYKN